LRNGSRYSGLHSRGPTFPGRQTQIQVSEEKSSSHQILTSHKQNCAVQKLMPMLEQIDNFTNGGLDNKLLALMAQPPKKKAKRATKKTYCSSHIFHEEEAPTPEKPQRKTNSPAFDCWPVVADCSHTDTVERDLREDIYDDFCKYYHFERD